MSSMTGPLDYLDHASQSLREATLTPEVAPRYAAAYRCAMRAATAVIAARAQPAATSGRHDRCDQGNLWSLLAKVAPELYEWAVLFASGAAKRAAAEAGSRHVVTAREADDLVRDADRFLGLVDQSLGRARGSDRVA